MHQNIEEGMRKKNKILYKQDLNTKASTEQNKNLIRYFLMLILLLSPFIILQIGGPIYYNRISSDKYPFLQWNNDPKTSISIMWETSFLAPTKVFWGDSPLNLNQSYIDLTPKNLHQVNITGLLPDTRYYYKISTDLGKALGEGKLYSFKTAPNNSEPFTFTVFGDNRENPIFSSSAEDIIFRRIFEKNPTFYISVGDIWYEGGNQNTVNRFFRYLGEIASNKTFMASVGNHEINHDQNLYLKYMNQPGDFYFGLNYSNVHFTFMAYPYTSYQSGEISQNWLNDEQINWLRKDLSENMDKDWRIVIIHSPIKSSAYFGDDLKAQTNLIPILDEFNVSCVFMGSDHHYEHLNINGLDYFVTGGGGAELAFLGLLTDNTELFTINYHYMYVKISSDKIVVESITYDNRLIERVEITKS
ncbi:MAG: fibronectin type III domain-containing protein [Promethearchaeota archaeon]